MLRHTFTCPESRAAGYSPMGYALDFNVLPEAGAGEMVQRLAMWSIFHEQSVKSSTCEVPTWRHSEAADESPGVFRSGCLGSSNARREDTASASPLLGPSKPAHHTQQTTGHNLPLCFLIISLSKLTRSRDHHRGLAKPCAARSGGRGLAVMATQFVETEPGCFACTVYRCVSIRPDNTDRP